MAILDFLNQNKDDIPTTEEPFTPKPVPIRGPGGKFVSKKSKVAVETAVPQEDAPVAQKSTKKKITQSEVKGPFMAPFAGKLIRKYYTNGKWYVAIEELIFNLSSDPPIKPLNQLKVDPKFKDLFEKEIKMIDGTDCVDCNGSAKILRQIIKTYDASFPGTLFQWLEDISTNKLELIEDEAQKEK